MKPYAEIPRMRARGHSSNAWLLLSLASALLAIRASQYADGNPGLYESFLREHYQSYLQTVAFHATFGILTLILGPILLHPGLRIAFPRAHRVLGYIYFNAVILGGATGLFMAQRSLGGPIAHCSFSVLSCLWILTVCIGVRFAIRREYKAHRRWMIRNYALTFSALSFRVLLTTLQQVGLTYENAYDLSALIGWPATLAFAELVMLRQGIKQRTLTMEKGLV